MTKIIFIFGDSITEGIDDEEMGGWADRLRVFLFQRSENTTHYHVYNLGISGNTSEDVVNRLEFEVGQRADADEDIVFLFAIGINDAGIWESKKEHRAAPDQFKDNLQYITALAKKYSPNIIFVGLTPADENKTCPVPWEKDLHYKNEEIEKYNEIIKKVCDECNLIFIDILNEFQKGDYKKLLSDGLHPNAAGHQKIFEIIKEALIENKII